MVCHHSCNALSLCNRISGTQDEAALEWGARPEINAAASSTAFFCLGMRKIAVLAVSASLPAWVPTPLQLCLVNHTFLKGAGQDTLQYRSKLATFNKHHRAMQEVLQKLSTFVRPWNNAQNQWARRKRSAIGPWSPSKFHINVLSFQTSAIAPLSSAPILGLVLVLTS